MSFESTIKTTPDQLSGNGWETLGPFDWGVFAVDTPWPGFEPVSIALWDYGISQALGYVGYVAKDWAANEIKVDPANGHTKTENTLPREIRFNAEFLTQIPRFIRNDETGDLEDYGVNVSDQVGNLKWRLVYNLKWRLVYLTHDRFPQETFVHAEFNGRKYVWQLMFKELRDTHCIMGRWKD